MPDSKKPSFFSRLRGRKPTEKIEKNTIIVAAPFGQPMQAQSKKPVLGSSVENNDKFDEYMEDPEIMRLQIVMLDRSPQNIRWVFNHDNACGTACFMLSQAISGSTGIGVKTKNDNLKQFLLDYFEMINVPKIIEKVMKDCLCFTESVWWLDYNREQKAIIPRWIDYLTLTPITNKFTGDKKWVQMVYIDNAMPDNNNGAWKKYEPFIDYFHLSQFMQEAPKDRLVKRHLFLDEVLNFEFFSSPPMLGIIDVCLWKKWMQYDAKEGGKKYATPLMDAAVELPEVMDLGSDEVQELMNQVAQDLNRLMNFGVLAHPSNVKVTPVAQSGQVFNFVQYLEYAEKQIHKAILVPANLLEAAGSELATSRTVKSMFDIAIKSLRKKFADIFKKLALMQADFVGKSVDPHEFNLIFSEEDAQQQLTQNEEFTALMQMFDRGILKDQNEVRSYVAKFGIELEQLTEQEQQLKDAEQQQTQGGQPAEQSTQHDVMDDIEKDIEGNIK